VAARERRSGTYHWLSLIAISCYRSSILSFSCADFDLCAKDKSVWRVKERRNAQQRSSKTRNVTSCDAWFASVISKRFWSFWSSKSSCRLRTKPADGKRMSVRRVRPAESQSSTIWHFSWYMAHLLHQIFTMYNQPIPFGCSYQLLDDAVGRVFQLSCNLGIDVGPVGVLKGKRIKVSHVRRTKYCTMKWEY